MLCLLQIVIEVRSAAQFQNGAEAVMVDLYCVKMFDYSAIVQFFVDFILSQRMLDVVILNLVIPTIVKVVDLASNFSAVL